MVATAETTAAIGKIVVDPCRLESRLRVAEQIGDRFRGLVRRLHADDELEVLAAGVVPGQAAFPLAENRGGRLRLAFPVPHSEGRGVSCKFPPALFARALRLCPT